MPYRVDMQTTLHPDADGWSVLTVSGEVDVEVSDELFAAGLGAISAAGTGLRVDLSGVTFMDSSGLAALIGIRNECSELKSLSLVAPSRQVRRLLEITGLAESFDVVG
jgi:anti-sigma B factor antagonist